MWSRVTDPVGHHPGLLDLTVALHKQGMCHSLNLSVSVPGDKIFP